MCSAALPSTPFLHVCSARLPPCRPHAGSIVRTDGHLTKLPPTPCIAACTTPKRYAFPAARFTVSVAVQRLPLSPQISEISPRTPWTPCTVLARARRSRPLASPVAAEYGHTAGEQGSGHGISAQCAAPNRTSRPPSPAQPEPGALFARDELRATGLTACSINAAASILLRGEPCLIRGTT